MIILGLTGSIGMGKSTTAAMFADAGIPVHDADKTVHDLYSGRAAPLVERAFPGTVTKGVVDRQLLGKKVLGDDKALKKLEEIIHPLVREEEVGFLQNAKADGADFVILDIPLLFETGGDRRVDGIIVVTADAEEQKRRVLSRPSMTEDKFLSILAKQTPDKEKRARADFVIDTGNGLENARAQVVQVILEIRAGNWRGKACLS